MQLDLFTKKIIFIYFSSAFSYAHLPLAKYHHGLGSIFNYVGFIAIISIFMLCGRKAFNRKAISFLVCTSTLLFFILITQIFSNQNLNLNLSLIGQMLSSFMSNFWELIFIFLMLGLLNFSDFRFVDLSKAIQISSVVLIVYMSFEVLGYTFSIDPFRSILLFINPYIQYRTDILEFGGRVRGFSNEPSYLAVVVIFHLTILLIGQQKNSKIINLIIFLIILLGVFSQSKNLYIGLGIIFIVHGIYYKARIPIIVATIILLGLVYYLYIYNLYSWQYEKYGFDISVITRVGSWAAALNGFIDSPLYGNGIGLAGYKLPEFYPDFFYNSPEASDWEYAAKEGGAPVFNNIFRTLFEAGILGLIFVILKIKKLIRCSNYRSYLAHDNVLMICGFLLCYSMVDVLSYFPWYIALAVNRDKVGVEA